MVQAASSEITFCLLLYFHESITHFFIMNGPRKALYIQTPYKANGIHEIKLIYINDFSRGEGKDDSEVEFCFLCFSPLCDFLSSRSYFLFAGFDLFFVEEGKDEKTSETVSGNVFIFHFIYGSSRAKVGTL